MWLAGILAAAITAAVTTVVSDTAKKIVGSEEPTTRASASIAVGATASPQVSTSEAPISIKPVTVERKEAGDYSWVFPDRTDFSKTDVGSITKKLFSDQADALMPKIGGVIPRGLALKLVVEGRSESPVRILDMQVEKTCVPVHGTAFVAFEQGGEGNIGIGFDLDQSKPLAQMYHKDAEREWQGAYFEKNSVSLKKSEQVVFQVFVMAHKNYCNFRLALVILHGDKIVRKIIDNNGSWYKISGLGGDKPENFGSFKALDRVYVADVRYGPRFFEVNPRTFKLSDDPRTSK
ncbi:hypothetical protein [Nonomuraea sp. JJY05]|uniref:hypothetical protein n=1 Tax=Nonomuraea sp. JJY05 TaxID=3350255 RepID=UPI00373EE726